MTKSGANQSIRYESVIQTLCLSLGFVLFLSFCSCRDTSTVSEYSSLEPSTISGDRAFEEVTEFFELGPKIAGTEGAAKAALYLAQKLREAGFDVDVDEFVEGGITYRNVVAGREVGDRGLVVLASHYDTKAGISDVFAGANDSASSTGLLLEMAKAIGQGPELPYDIYFAFLDGEECRAKYSDSDGLHGSKRLASRLAGNVLAVIVLDMIGDSDLTVTLPRNSSSPLLDMVFDAARDEGVRSKFSLSRGNILDDHVPFIRKGFPAVDIIDFQYGSSVGKNDYWHSDLDTMDKISAESLGIIGRVVIRMLNKLMGT